MKQVIIFHTVQIYFILQDRGLVVFNFEVLLTNPAISKI